MEPKGEGEPKKKEEGRRLTPQERVLFGLIDRRVERVLTNPILTEEQKTEMFTLADLTKLCVYWGNTLALQFKDELVEFTNPLLPKEPPKEG